jgi:2-aminoethylphosphonate dioxygenase
MILENKDLKKKISTEGFFTYKNAFDKKFISNVINDIDNAKGTIKYFDNNKNLRRIEKLYDKGNSLNLLNKKITMILKDVLDEEFIIFKDKFNAKPPGGDGFFAHYDGIFKFIDHNNNKKNGWYEYGNFFISALVALDKCDKKNGTIEIANTHLGDFNTLLKNTKNDGTPAIKKEIEDIVLFKSINLEIGDMLIFLHTCPHRSNKNNSNKNRRIIYYTYTKKKYGSKYNQYFKDKESSKNTSKALVERKKII